MFADMCCLFFALPLIEFGILMNFAYMIPNMCLILQGFFLR